LVENDYLKAKLDYENAKVETQKAKQNVQLALSNVKYQINIPNETELSLLTGMEVRDITSTEKAARVLLQRGAKHVIVTLGSKGALIVDMETSTHVDMYTCIPVYLSTFFTVFK
jgi:fructose-1-phosphate kinase PfkB-like protein